VTDVGDLLTPTLTVSPFDGTTAASLSITAPDGTVTAGTGEASADGGETWTADNVTLNAAGMWVFAWTVTGTGQGVEYSTVVIVELERDANDFIARTLEQRCHDRGIDAARHGHDHARLRGLSVDL
jgi:hypothetical protein